MRRSLLFILLSFMAFQGRDATAFQVRDATAFQGRDATAFQGRDATAFQVRHMYGEWIIWHSTSNKLPPTNRVVVHVYPNDALTVSYRYECGPFVCRREKIGSYKFFGSPDNQNLYITLENQPDKLLSCMGVGVEFLGIHESTIKNPRAFKMNLRLDLDPRQNNLFLSSANDKTSFHLVRSIRVNEPKIDVPLGTFIFTQILGNLIAQMLVEIAMAVKHIH